MTKAKAPVRTHFVLRTGALALVMHLGQNFLDDGRVGFGAMLHGDGVVALGAFADVLHIGFRKDKAEVARNLEKVYNYFPRLKTRRTSQAAYTSGGEQQMCAIGRALMANPNMVLLDEPSMGLAPQIVEEVFNIVKDLNTKEKVTFLLAEQNTNMALRYADYGYIMESGRIVMDGAAADLASNEDVKEFYLGMGGGERKSFKVVVVMAHGGTLAHLRQGLKRKGKRNRAVRPASACAACSS